jgi:hypothetical protein
VRTNPFYDAWLFLIGRTSDHENSGAGWLLTILFICLLVAIGMVYVAQLWLGLYLSPTEWPWLYIFLIFVQGFFVLDNAGRSLGLDAILARAPIAPFVGDGFVARLYRKIA